MTVLKERVSLALSKGLIKLIDRRRGRASRSAEVEYLIKLGLKYDLEQKRGGLDGRLSNKVRESNKLKKQNRELRHQLENINSKYVDLNEGQFTEYNSS